MSKFSTINAVQDLGILMIGGLAVWLIGLVDGEVKGINLGFSLRILCASVLVIGLLLINVIWPIVRRRRAKREAEAYAQSFRYQIDAEARRIDAQFGIR